MLPGGDFAAQMSALVDKIKSTPRRPGVDEIRWPRPVRPGDSLKIRLEILDARVSRSKPDRGIVRAKLEALNQRDEIVLSMLVVSILGRRL